jgi:EpsI family protein
MVYVPIAVAVVLMVSAGYVQGVWSERWSTFPELEILSDQLKAVPQVVGDWRGTDAEKMDEQVKKIAGAEGTLTRTYANSAGEEVQVSIICGRLQHVTDHTPDRCYPAAGFEMESEPVRDVIDYQGGSGEFFTTSFMKSEAAGRQAVRGYWAWSGDGEWAASDNPKFSFAGQQHALYKLYVFANVPSGANKRPSDQDFCKEFIRQFIPTLNASLKPAFEKTGRLSSEGAAPAPAGEQPAAAAPAA